MASTSGLHKFNKVVVWEFRACVCARVCALTVCTCVCNTCVHGKHLEVRDNLKELDFSFYHVGPQASWQEPLPAELSHCCKVSVFKHKLHHWQTSKFGYAFSAEFCEI